MRNIVSVSESLDGNVVSEKLETEWRKGVKE